MASISRDFSLSIKTPPAGGVREALPAYLIQEIEKASAERVDLKPASQGPLESGACAICGVHVALQQTRNQLAAQQRMITHLIHSHASSPTAVPLLPGVLWLASIAAVALLLLWFLGFV